jgi:hypothetical protein
MLGFMLKSTHKRLMAEQVIADTDARHRLNNEHEIAMAEFKRATTDRAAHESQALRSEVLQLREEIAVLNGKLVHHRAEGGEEYAPVPVPKEEAAQIRGGNIPVRK